jgi:hypothetical protein
MKTNYPVFEANQVLTNKHLNDAFNYLDDHILQTRHKLIGKGITCGLSIRVSDKSDSITITKGCALTSAGYLIEVEEDTTYTAYNTYTLPDNGEAQPDMAAYLFNYTYFKNGNNQVPLWQMLPSKVENADQLLNANFIGDKAILLFLEPKLENLRNCDTTDCNDKGQRMTFTLRPILIGQRELTIVLQQAGVDMRDPLIMPQLKKSINPINTARYDAPATFTLTTSRAINAAFYNLINKNNMISQLHTEINKAYMAWGEDANANPFLKLDSTLLSKLKSFDTDREKIFIQYYYDFLEDLIRTYHELRDKGLMLCRYCCQEVSNFPLHVALGVADENTTRKIQLFRHYFIAAGTDKEQKKLHEEIAFLFGRLSQMISAFSLPQAIFNNQSDNDPIYITPSNLGCTPLGDRAIPWYYSLNSEGGLMQNWNYRHFYFDNMDELRGYGISRYNLGGINRQSVTIESDNECKNFFRIEGHVGKHVRTAMSSILGNRNKFRIPFNVVALAARSSDKDLLMDAIFFNDLESQYTMNNNRLKESLTTFRGAINPKTTQLLADLALSDSGRMVSYFNQQMSKAATERDSPEVMTTRVSEMMTAYNNPTLLNTATETNTRKLSTNYLTNYNANIYTYIIPTLYFDFSAIQYRFSVGQISNHIKTLTGYIDQVTNLLKPTTINAFNLEDFKSAYKVFDNYFKNMHTWLKGLSDEEKKQISNYTTLINAFAAYKACCLDDSFDAILEENARRKDEFRSQFVFNNFIQAHPGIEHKAGVTRGGTFILVYHLNPDTEANTNLSVAAGSRAAAAAAASNTATSAAARTANTDATRAAAAETKTTATNFAINNAFLNSLSEVQLNQFSSLVSGIDLSAAIAAPSDLLLNDYTVIADFYLPYPVNFSGGPITYVLSEADQQPDVPLQISGMVVDAKTGKTLAGAAINYNNQVVGTTNSDGRFDLVIPEKGTVTFSAKGYLPQDLLVAKPETSLTIKLEPQSTKVTVAGFVADSVNQRAIFEADLSVNQKSVGSSNERGEFSITVEIGNSIVFSKTGFNTFTHVVTKAEDKLIIPLVPIEEKTITRRGRITSTNQQPLPGVNVLEPKTGRSTISGSKGEFSIETLPETSLNFTLAGFTPVSRICTESEVELFIVMQANTEQPKQVAASGIVMDAATGGALAGAIISSKASGKVIGKSEEGGKFSVTTVPFDALEFVREGYSNQSQKLSDKDEEFKILMNQNVSTRSQADAGFAYSIAAKFINQAPTLMVSRATVKDYLGFIITATANNAGMSSYNWSSSAATTTSPVQKQTTQLAILRSVMVSAKGTTITLKTTSGSQVLESSQAISVKELATYLLETLVKKGGLAERQATVMVNEVMSTTTPSDPTLKMLAQVFA